MNEPDFDAVVREAGEEARTLAATQAAALAEQNAQDDLRWLMDQKAGRRIVWRLLSRAGVNGTTFNPDQALHAFFEGRRHVGVDLQNEVIKASTELFIQMLRENNEAAK